MENRGAAVAEETILDRAVRFLHDEVAPNAGAIDVDPELLKAIIARAGAAKLLALKRPIEYGGPGLPEEEFRRFQEEAARASGAFAFLQTQHQSAVSLIAKNATPEFAARVLVGTDDGSNLIGVGFSQLRRSGLPMVTAEPENIGSGVGGYRIRGRVPWVTGYDIFARYLLGATLPTGEAAFLLAPLEEGPRIGVKGPMRLTAMESANTVALDIDGLLIPEFDLAFVKPMDWIAGNDLLNIALQSHFAFGCARAGIDVVRTEGRKTGKEFLLAHADRFELELDALRKRTDASATDLGEGTAPERLKLRAHAIELAARCAHAAVTAASGAANALGHPAGRIYREAIVYTVSAQTLPIMAATMDRLSETRG